MRVWLLYVILSVSIIAETRAVDIVANGMKNEQRVALVIGNSNYKSFNILKNPINDAAAMRDILEKKGFFVIYLEDGSQLKIEEAIETFALRLKKGKGIGLFYYAGHGIEVDGVNYLIPTDARIPSKKFVKSKSVSTDIIVSAMEEAKNRINILILDSCRSNPFARGSSGGLAPLNSATGIYVAYATAPGKVAEDGDSNNGLFTKYLIKYINENGLTIENVFKKVRRDVKISSNGGQIPWSSSSIDGEFYFTLPKKNLTKKKSILTPLGEIKAHYTPTFKTIPIDAKVEIEGVDNWYKGMSLKRGIYTIRVSKNGYITQKFKMDLESSDSFTLKIYKKPLSKNRERWSSEIYRGKRDFSRVGISSIRDNYTGLVWQRDNSEAGTKNWIEAKKYCEKLQLDNHNSWRLATIKEIYYLGNIGKLAIDSNYFELKKGWYWSSTPYKQNPSNAWSINLYKSNSSWGKKSSKLFVLCVHK